MWRFNRYFGFLFVGICLMTCYGCIKDTDQAPVKLPGLMEIPEGFPDVEFPADNVFTLDRWKLGKKLFFDPIMSRDSSISCASCHLPELAFSDRYATSPGILGRPGTRNTPSLGNVAYQPFFTREGGLPTLEQQVGVPVQEHNEFDFNLVLLTQRLEDHPDYVDMAQKAYGRSPDHFVVTRSIACFERSIITGNSRYDQYIYQGNKHAMSANEIRGMNLFMSDRLKCTACHGGFNFTNYAFENNGLYETYEDPGRFRLTGLESDRARFKVPGLRNVGLTGPYMHDGSLETLNEVIDHYSTGIKDHPNTNPILKPLYLSVSEKEDLIHFLHSLTDETLIINPIFKNE